MNSINIMSETTSRLDASLNFLPVVWIRINVFRATMRVTAPVSGHVEDEGAVDPLDGLLELGSDHRH